MKRFSGEINDSYDTNSILSDEDSQGSSLSANFINAWPDTNQYTYQYVRDTQIDLKKHQIERHGIEMESELIERETVLQTEIRDITSEVTELRLQLSQLEIELGKIQEQKTYEMISIRTSLANKLREFHPILTDCETTIGQLEAAIEAQRENHDRNVEIVNVSKSDHETQLENEIGKIQREIDQVRKSTLIVTQKYDVNMADAETTIDLLNSEISTLLADRDKIAMQNQQIKRNLSSMKRELIVADEISASLHEQIAKNSQLRARIKGSIDRAKLNNWKLRSESLRIT